MLNERSVVLSIKTLRVVSGNKKSARKHNISASKLHFLDIQGCIRIWIV